MTDDQNVDPIEQDQDAAPGTTTPTSVDGPVEHPTGEAQAEENADNEPPA